MKKLGILSLVFALVMVFAMPTGVFAAEPEALPDPGTTPDSSFYFADKWGKQISMMFTFKTENKVQKALRYAEERLAEVEAMAAQNKVQAMEKAANEYQNCLAIATQNMGKAMIKGVDTTEQVTAMMSNHIAFMYQRQYAYQQGGTVCEDCQQIRQQVRERAATCQEAAVEALVSQDPEAALKLNLSLMQQEWNRLQNRVGQEDNGQLGGALQQYERLRAMNQEMIANAEQLGLGPEAQQMVQQATATQEGVLNQVRNQLQFGSVGSTDAPVQNHIQEQERLGLDSGNTSTGAGSGQNAGYGKN
ncbi:MAG: DUF5667 domain-containing protein [Dehalococcoidales bacterium]|nr:DUF5667 domain-containing protein [Dehalococcoidales bacterium]